MLIQEKIITRIRILALLLVVMALGIIFTGGLLQWRLKNIQQYPRSIAEIGLERHLVHSIQEAAAALLNSNDDVSFGKNLQDLKKGLAGWEEAHAKHYTAAGSTDIPEPIRTALTQTVFPMEDELLRAVDSLYFKLEANGPSVVIAELRPNVANVREVTSVYLNRLDRLDLLLANKTYESIRNMRSWESFLIIAAGIGLLGASLWLSFPANQVLIDSFARQKQNLEQIKLRNNELQNLQALVRDRQQLALDVSQTGTFVWHQASNELEWDQNLSRLYGISDPRSVKRVEDFLSFVHEEDRPKVMRHIQKTVEWSEDTVDFRIKVGKDIRWIRDRSRAIMKPEGLDIIGACIDETDLMREIENAHQSRKEAERVNQSKTEFVAHMSHDMRTPLAAILGFTEIMHKRPQLSEDERANYLNRIIRNGQSLLQMIEELLDTSRLDSGSEIVSITRFELNQLIDDLRDSHGKKMQEKGLDFAVHFEQPMPGSFYGDQTLLKRVLDNLISNAVRYSDHGTINLTVSLATHPVPEKIDVLMFRVKDFGRGIEEERRKTIFEAFTPREKVSDSFKSTGLGLYITQKLAALMGGHVSLEWSEVGQGSEFLFTVPVKVTAKSARDRISTGRPELRVVKPEANDLASLSVLLVEDSPDVRYLHELFLAAVDIKPAVAEDGEKALKILSEKKFDVVLMDIGLPGISGIDVTAQLREKGYSGTIIAVSAHAFAQEVDRALHAGCDQYLTKPLNSELLYQALRDQLNRRRPRFELR